MVRRGVMQLVLAAAAAMAGPASAECFEPPDRLPAAVVFDDGARTEFLSRNGDSWAYISLKPGRPPNTVRVSHGGLALVSFAAKGGWIIYSWADPIPDAAELKGKGPVTVSGTLRHQNGKLTAATIQLTWIDDAPFTLNGCVYPAITFRRVLSWNGKVVTDSVLTLSQTLGVTFLTSVTAPNLTSPVVFRAVRLE